MLTEEKLNLNFVNFVNKLKKYNCYTEELDKDEDFKNKLRIASAFTDINSGGAYAGSLIEHINRITSIAFNLNSVLSNIKLDDESLFKVCYLHQIAKAMIMEQNDTDWEVKKGKLFRFIDNPPAIKIAEYSLYLCNIYKINLTIEEYEAILSVDKTDDKQTIFFGSMLSQLLRSAIDLATTERRILYKENANNK